MFERLCKREVLCYFAVEVALQARETIIYCDCTVVIGIRENILSLCA